MNLAQNITDHREPNDHHGFVWYESIPLVEPSRRGAVRELKMCEACGGSFIRKPSFVRLPNGTVRTVGATVCAYCCDRLMKEKEKAEQDLIAAREDRKRTQNENTVTIDDEVKQKIDRDTRLAMNKTFMCKKKSGGRILSLKEAEVARMIAQGEKIEKVFTAAQLASRNAAQVMASRIYRKLGVIGRQGLTNYVKAGRPL